MAIAAKLAIPPILIIVLSVVVCRAKVGGWESGGPQFHIQTDEGPERYFKYQTLSGQYRKEKRLQDGSVVGSYGWVDANGFLRLKDYVADDKGYRIVRTKLVKVGVGTPIDDALAAAKGATVSPKPLPPISLSDYLKEQKYVSSTPAPPISLSDYLKNPEGVEINHNSFPSSTPAPTAFPSSTPSPSYPSSTTPAYIRPQTFRPYFNPNSIYAYDKYDASQQVPVYQGVSLTQNGFRYYLPRHYHEEESSYSGDRRAGSFGYIDPFGIRRVIYYNTSPGSGFLHRKNNKYVGFNAPPYDPRY